MVVDDLVPELQITSPDRLDVLLPEQAESGVEVWKGNDGFEAYGYEGGGHFWAQHPGLGVFRFRDDDPGVVAVGEPGVPEPLIEDAYYRNVLPVVLHLRGYEVLHASAVSGPGGLVVLCGVSGTGKSTFAHALSERGHPAWADDAVVIEARDREAVAVAVPFRLRLHGAAATHFAHKPDPTVSNGTPPQPLLHALAILAPQDSADSPIVEIERLPAAVAFTALLPHAYYFRLSDPTRNALMIDRYLRLASLVSTFEVRYRPGLGHVDAVLDEIEQRVLAG